MCHVYLDRQRRHTQKHAVAQVYLCKLTYLMQTTTSKSCHPFILTGLFSSLTLSHQARCIKTSSETCLRRTTISLQVKRQHKKMLKSPFKHSHKHSQKQTVWSYCDDVRGRTHTERKWEGITWGAWRWRAVEFSSALYFPSSPGQSALPLSL